MPVIERMKNHYRQPNDLSSRLNGTFARYDGVPVYLSYQGDGSNIQYYSLPVSSGRGQSTPVTISVSDEKLDISSIELGYMNQKFTDERLAREVQGKERVFYLFREPQKRSYRQGISEQTIIKESLDGSRGFGTVGYSDLGFINLLYDRYPSHEEALEIFDRNGEVAFSKHTAASKNKLGIVTVYHRGEAIGYMTPDTKEVICKKSENAWILRRILANMPWKVRNDDL